MRCHMPWPGRRRPASLAVAVAAPLFPIERLGSAQQDLSASDRLHSCRNQTENSDYPDILLELKCKP